jgi:hypothetical protein
MSTSLATTPAFAFELSFKLESDRTSHPTVARIASGAVTLTLMQDGESIRLCAGATCSPAFPLDRQGGGGPGGGYGGPAAVADTLDVYGTWTAQGGVAYLAIGDACGAKTSLPFGAGGGATIEAAIGCITGGDCTLVVDDAVLSVTPR